MKTLWLILVLLILVSCENEQPKNSFIPNQQTDTNTAETPVLENDSALKTQKNTNWEVVLEINEGFFESYTINYGNGKQLTIPVDNTIPLIGGVDHPPAHFINDTTYFVPHIAGSKNGHFELYIYKNGTCNYKEVITRKSKPVIIEVEETDISQAPHSKPKQSEIINNYIQTATETEFTRTIKNFGNPSIGCSDSQTEISFSIPNNNTDSFYISNNDLKNLNFSYHYSGGLYEETSKELLKGYIKGINQTDNSWLIESDIWFLTTSFPNEKSFEKELKLNEIYK